MNNQEYLYIHIISYFVDNNRPTNINTAVNHLNIYKLSSQQKEKDKNLFILYVLYNELTNELINFYDKFKELKTDKTDILVLYRYNTGGTIQTMYYAYKYILEHNITSKYIGTWEDDEIFKNDNLLDKVQEYLNDDYILVGSLFNGNNKDTNYTDGVKKFLPPYSKRVAQVPWCKKYHIYNNSTDTELIHDSLYMWIDGRVYLTTIDNLKIIENKMKKFTLAPENEVYTHCQHGINYGEVGFCTRLHINGFKFYGLPAEQYFKELDENSTKNKYI